jgi:hypothetical protein
MALVLVVVHPIIIFGERPEMLPLLNVFEAPWRPRFAVAPTVALLALVASRFGGSSCACTSLARPSWHSRRAGGRSGDDRPYRVTTVRPERGSAWTLALEPERHTGFRLQPGQFAWHSANLSRPATFRGSYAPPIVPSMIRPNDNSRNAKPPQRFVAWDVSVPLPGAVDRS